MKLVKYILNLIRIFPFNYLYIGWSLPDIKEYKIVWFDKENDIEWDQRQMDTIYNHHQI